MKKRTAEWWLQQYHTVFGCFIWDAYDSQYPVDGIGQVVNSHEEEIISKLYCEEMIKVLSPWQQTVIRLRIDGYDNATIAKQNNCAYSVVSRALRHARKRLRGTSIDPR